MKLLIVTQKVDREDDGLGFFHQWLESFAEVFEHITVICLGKGEYHLPQNVEVFSLGKEKNVAQNKRLPRSDLGELRQGPTLAGRLRYVWNFYRLIFKRRSNYDAVFVHMNPEYVVLGGWLWRLWGKRVALWYNHRRGGLRVQVAALFAERIFYTSPYAYACRFKHARQMPAGIDTKQFTPSKGVERSENSILLLGRISPVKYVEIMIQALIILDERGIDFVATCYGDPTDRDHAYNRKIRALAKPLEEKGKIFFCKGVPNYKTPSIYSAHEFFLNATPRGSLDKSVPEAALCSALPVVCNESFENILPKELFFKEGNANDLAMGLELLFSLRAEQRVKIGEQIREAVIQKHSLEKLTAQILTSLG